MICGDCREYLADLPSKGVAVITDPPYGVNWNTAKPSRSNLSSSGIFPPIHGDNEPFDPAHLLRFETVVLFGANWYTDRLPARGGWIVWDKRNGITPNDYGDCELAWTNRNAPVRMFNYLWSGLFAESKKRKDESGKRLHPTQKPVALFKWIISLLALPPDTLIVDPYLGSGSCGVAAGELGYKFLGIEIERQYCDVAIRRIGVAFAQPQLERMPHV